MNQIARGDWQQDKQDTYDGCILTRVGGMYNKIMGGSIVFWSKRGRSGAGAGKAASLITGVGR